MSDFRFKQFSIKQDNTAMKVGTDGVLLGAWVNCKKAKTILDIGAGTGLISLMLAQRNLDANIIAIELENAAALQCKENFETSIWNKRLSLIQGNITDYAPSSSYDLIVSNPPFFNASFKNENKSKSIARHRDSLTFENLLHKTSSLLNLKGIAAFIIPFSEKNNFIALAKAENLFLKRITYVKGNETAAIKRILLEFNKNESTFAEDELNIEISRHKYTKDYINLTKEFYLNM